METMLRVAEMCKREGFWSREQEVDFNGVKRLLYTNGKFGLKQDV